MAKNLSRRLAEMDDESRRRFALEEVADDGGESPPAELRFDDPRDSDRMGRHAQEESPQRAEEETMEAAEAGAGGPRRRARATGGRPRRGKGAKRSKNAAPSNRTTREDDHGRSSRP